MLHYIGPKETKTPCGIAVQLSTVNPELIECDDCLELRFPELYALKYPKLQKAK